MANLFSLFAGAESYMEDIDIDVNVGTEPAEPAEVVEESEEAVDNGNEIVETSSDAETTETATEEMCKYFDEVDRMMGHIQRFGVDRSFLSLMNYNNRLSRAFHISFPSCESYATTGSPYSAESMAAMEGLKEVAKRVWDFIKSVFSKIGSIIGRMVEAIRTFFTNADKNIGRLNKALKERSDIDSKDAKDIKVNIVDTDAVKAYADGVGKQDIVSSVKEAEKQIKALNDAVSSGSLPSDLTNDDSETVDKAIENTNKQLKEAVDKALKKNEVDVTNASTRAAEYLKNATTIRVHNESDTKVADNLKLLSKQGVSVAENAVRRTADGNSDAAKKARTTAKYVNTLNSFLMRRIKNNAKVANAAIKAASVLINRGMKKN